MCPTIRRNVTIVTAAFAVTLCLTANFAAAGEELASWFDDVEIQSGVGLWVPFLPNYDAASIHDTLGGTPTFVPNVFSDPQTSAGVSFDLSGRKQITDECSWMTRGFYAIAENRNSASVADPAGADEVVMVDLDANNFIDTSLAGPMNFAFESEVQNYGIDSLIFRDYDVHGGRLSLGGGFSYMGFTQDFYLMGQTPFFTTMYLESVQTNYYGGKISAMWCDNCRHHPIDWDIALGLYGMDARYTAANEVHDGDEEGPMMRLPGMRDSLTRVAGTIEAHVGTEWTHGICTVRPRIGFRYLSDFPVINHPMLITDPPAYLSSSDAFFLTFDVELLLY